MIPFDLKRVDSNWGNPNAPSLVDRVMTLGKTYLAATGKEHESAAVMLARLLTRKDTSATHLPKFLEWATQQSLETTDMFFVSTLYILFYAHNHQLTKLINSVQRIVDLTRLHLQIRVT